MNALAWYKSPSINGVSPNALKLLDKLHRQILFRFIKQWMDDPSVIFKEWTRSKLKSLPKKGDLTDLNN